MNLHELGIQGMFVNLHLPQGESLTFYLPHLKLRGFQIKVFQSIYAAENVIGISRHPIWKDKDMHELLVCYLILSRLKHATNPEDGLDLYVKLLSLLNNDGFQV